MKLKYGIRATARRLQIYRNMCLQGGNYVPPPIGHHLDDVPRAAQRHRSLVLDDVIGGVNRPRESSLLRVVQSQKTRLHNNIIKHK